MGNRNLQICLHNLYPVGVIRDNGIKAVVEKGGISLLGAMIIKIVRRHVPTGAIEAYAVDEVMECRRIDRSIREA